MIVTIVAPVVARIGGMERAMTELAEGLLSRGHRVVIIALHCELTPHPALRVIRVTGPRRPASLSLPWFMLAADVCRHRFAEGLLHTQGPMLGAKGDVVTAQFCHHAFRDNAHIPRRRRDTLPYRVNERVDGWINRRTERMAYRPSRTHRLVTVAHGMAAELTHYFPDMRDRIDVVPNGVDLDLFRPDPPLREEFRAEHGLGGDLVALFVGGDWERKGLRFAIEGVAKAPAWSLLVLGDGDRRAYGALAERSRAANRVRFLGQVRDPERAFASADAFVLPTAYEAFPLVALEAAAAGLPLVVTRGNGTEELVAEGENGFFVDRDGESVAARLRQLESAPELLTKMRASARESVSGYTWTNVVDRYIEIYAT